LRAGVRFVLTRLFAVFGAWLSRRIDFMNASTAASAAAVAAAVAAFTAVFWMRAAVDLAVARIVRRLFRTERFLAINSSRKKK
jgi:hypothetical protein